MARTHWPRDSRKEHFWRQHVQRWQGSGLTVRDFCRRQQLSEPSFYNWKRELAKRDRESVPATPGRKRRAARRSPPSTSDFVPVHVVPVATLEVVVRTGQTVRVGAGFDAAHLRAVVAALEATPC